MKYVLALIMVGLVASAVVQPTMLRAQTDTGGSTSGSLVEIPSPISCRDIDCLIAQVIRYILGIIAVIATLMFVWGGVMMLTSAGNADRVKKAKETLAWAAVGIVVILLSWTIIRFVLQGLRS